MNSRLDEMQAAILRARLPFLPRWTERRRALAARVPRGACGASALDVPREFDAGHVYHLFPVLTDERDRFQAHLRDQGVETLIHYPVPIPRQPALAGASPAMCPRARTASARKSCRCRCIRAFPTRRSRRGPRRRGISAPETASKPPLRAVRLNPVKVYTEIRRFLMRRTLLIVALSFLAAAPAAAQQLKLAFHEGLVSVDATSVPVRADSHRVGEAGRHEGGRRRAHHRCAAHAEIDRCARIKALEDDSAQRGRLHGGAARHRHRRVDVRPHPGDGHVRGTGRAAPTARPSDTARIPAMNGTQRFVPPRQRQTDRRRRRREGRGRSESAEPTGVHLPAAAGHGATRRVPEHAAEHERAADDRQPGERRSDHCDQPGPSPTRRPCPSAHRRLA